MIKLLLSLFVFFTIAHTAFSQNSSSNLKGAWQRSNGSETLVMICSDRFFSIATYSVSDNAFKGTHGGAYQVVDGAFVEKQEYNTQDPEMIGREISTPAVLNNESLLFKKKEGDEQWTRIDDGSPGELAGAWLITGRMQNGEMSSITPGARRTMKILSGTRFQWIAYNMDTKEFFGTGGGTYTTSGSEYTERIEFFSRDASRVGKSLEFDFNLENNKWRHVGVSSKGDPIDEVWTKRETLGL